MARYNKKILVPYLYNVYCIELANRKLEQQYQQYTNVLNNCIAYENKKISKPDKKYIYREVLESPAMLIILAGIMGLIFGMGYLFLEFIGFSSLIRIWKWICIGFYVVCAPFVIWEALVDIFHAISFFKRTSEEWEKWNDGRKKNNEKMNEYKYEVDLIKKRLDQVRGLRSNVYAVNIIPSHNRSLYTAYYLYEFFRTSDENDVTLALQTMLLEEIVKKLNQIINQLQEVTLNQRCMMAQIDKQNDKMDKNHRQLMSSVVNIEKKQDIQNKYLKMLDNDVQITNYFAMASYLKNR